ncbi:MAG TPA: hypothetical protein VLH18_04500 [Candidatus Limnocylindrales bacterium]|nr:hypothetical protein [Candidatus Limnocylindrales bacterium]
MGRKKANINPGDVFGRLTIVEELEKKNHNRQFLCKCECGAKTTVDSSKLISKNTQSCGCLKREIMANKNRTHGKSKTPLYSVWNSMKGRCYNPSDAGFRDYGGRGITVCGEWQEFEPFMEWALKSGYRKGLTIERVDNNGNYEPQNCKWIPRSEQSANRRTNRYLKFRGNLKTMAQWSRDLGINYDTLKDRLNNGWPVERALTVPVGSTNNFRGGSLND